MYEDFFAERVAKLREQRGVSARDMSLSLGQNRNYINQIENKIAFPSMQGFFFICEYFGLTPNEFFDDGIENPAKVQKITNNLKKLNDAQLDHVDAIVEDLAKK